MSKRTIIIIVVVVCVLGGGTLWAMLGRTDREVRNVQNMMKELDDENLSQDQRREKGREAFQAMRDLTPEQREALAPMMQERMEKRMDEWEKREDERALAYVAMSPAERRAELDKEIEEGLKRAKEREAWAKQKGNSKGGGRRPGDAAKGGSSQSGTSQVGGSRPDRGPRMDGGGGGRGKMTPEKAAQRRKARLDKSTPEARAARQLRIEDMNKRRAERGLPPLQPGRGRGGPWRG